MKTTPELMGLQDALVKVAGVREELRNFLEAHPSAAAGLLGGGLGALQGAIFSDQQDRLKHALLGYGLGAAHGALLNFGSSGLKDAFRSGLGGAGLAGMWLSLLRNKRKREAEQEETIP